jgi:hypothetical protein
MRSFPMMRQQISFAGNGAQDFVSRNFEEGKELKTIGEPGRTRTCNPLIKSQLLYH